MKLYSKLFPYVFVVGFTLLTLLVVWSPFLLKADTWFGLKIQNPGFQYIYQNFDGPFYVVASKTLYDPQKISPPGKGLIISLPLTHLYFAAHLPLYPLMMRLFSPLIGFLKSMIFTNVLFSILLAIFFYFFIKKLNLSKNPLFLTFVFLMLPRFLVVRSIGAPESLFLILILLSLYFFEQKNYALTGIFGGLSAATKSPGVLLFGAYLLVFLEQYIKTKKIDSRWFFIFFIPFGLLAVFLLYYVQYGDFFAYFKSGDNIHLVAPYSVFNYQNVWVGTGWLEEIIFYLFLYALTVFSLWKSRFRSFFYFGCVFFLAVLSVAHKDIPRYALPLWPLSCIAFEKFFTSKRFLIVSVILLPALFAYSWNFLLYNIMPIADWSPFL